MKKLLGYLLGAGRITSVIGIILGVPGVYDAIQQFAAGHPVSLRGLVSSVGAVLLGRFAAVDGGQKSQSAS